MIKRNCFNMQLIILILVCFTGKLFSQQGVDPSKVQVGAASLWEAALGDVIKGSPHLQTSSAVLVGENGSVKSFFMSGTPLWNFDAKKKAVPFIARSYEATSYICSIDGVFMAINRVGRELWHINLEKPITHPPVTGWDGRVFIPVDSGMTCRTASGHALWTLDFGSTISFSPILDHKGSVVTVLQNNDFIKLDQFSHLERIKLNRLPFIIVSLLEDKTQSYVLLYQSGEMEKIIFNDSSPEGNKLSKSGFGSLPGAPVSAAGMADRFTIILKDGKTLLLNSQGKIVWTKNSHEAVEEKGNGNLSMNQASMVFDERGIYAISTRGVTGFTDEGRRRFVFRMNIESSGIPAFSDEGLLYACGKDNILRVFKIDSKPRTISQTRFYGPEPEGTYEMGNPPPSPWLKDRERFNHQNQEKMYAEIYNAVHSGRLGKNEPVYTAYLMEMISFFLTDPSYSPVRPSVTPPQRVKLISLLALIGSRETIPFLWNIFDKDPEPAIRRACADAIGLIGVDPTGRSFVSYYFLLSPNSPTVEPELVIAAASSIARLCRFSGPPLSPEGIRVLRYLSNLSSIPNHVRNLIRNEIDGLYREGLDTVIQ